MVLKSIKANAALFILLLILFAILLFVPVISWKYPLAFLCSLTLFIIIYSDKLLGINIGDIDLFIIWLHFSVIKGQNFIIYLLIKLIYVVIFNSSLISIFNSLS